MVMRGCRSSACLPVPPTAYDETGMKRASFGLQAASLVTPSAARRGFCTPSLVQNAGQPPRAAAHPGRNLRCRTAVLAAIAAAQHGTRCVPWAHHELAAEELAEERQHRLPEAELRLWLHADERGRLHRREQLRERVHGRLLRQSHQLPPQCVLGRRLLLREPGHLPGWVPRLPGHLPTVAAAAVTAVAAVATAVATDAVVATVATDAAVAAAGATSITPRALLSWRRLRVLGRQPVRQ